MRWKKPQKKLKSRRKNRESQAGIIIYSLLEEVLFHKKQGHCRVRWQCLFLLLPIAPRMAMNAWGNELAFLPMSIEYLANARLLPLCRPLAVADFLGIVGLLVESDLLPVGSHHAGISHLVILL